MNTRSRSVIGGVGVALVFVLSRAVADGLPDMLGIQLGMPLREASAKLQSQLPQAKASVQSTRLPTIDAPVVNQFAAQYGSGVQGVETETVTVDVTMPPSTQSVWRITRQHYFPDKGIAKTALLSSLREKYGKETVANPGSATPSDSQITNLVWVYDEQGRPASASEGARAWMSCSTEGATLAGIEIYLAAYKGQVPQRDWCYAHFTAVYVAFSQAPTPELYDYMQVTAVSLPLATHAAEATAKFKKDADDAAHKQDLEKANEQAKPKL